MTPFGELLVRHRRSLDITQEELAERAKVSVRTISDLERGVARSARRDTAKLLADALGLDETSRVMFDRAARGRPDPSPAPAHQARPPVPAPEYRPAGVLHGRNPLLDHLVELSHRAETNLITLTGPGGVGKTRVAREFLTRTGDAGMWPDGSLFLRLESLRTHEAVLPALARELGVRDGGDLVLPMAISRVLAARRMLIVLDNVEHVVEAAAQLGPIVEQCPRTMFLCTSRVALRLRTEQRYEVRPLDVPGPGAGDGAALEVPAVQLFVERIRAVEPAWVPHGDEIDAIVQVCRRLDGLPLALELAASRVRTVGLKGLAQRSAGLALLSRGPRDAPDRHRTLDHTIRWSHDLLGHEAQLVLQRLAVFTAGFTVDAAEYVCTGDDEPLDVMDALADLIDASMLSRTDGLDGRLSMLQTIREFAARGLAGAGEEDRVRMRHALYMADLVDGAEVGYVAGQSHWTALLRENAADLATALRTAVAAGATATALSLAHNTWRGFLDGGDLHEARHLISAALDLPGGDPLLRAHVLRGGAVIADELGDVARAEQWWLAGRQLYLTAGHHVGAVTCLNGAGTTEWSRGDYAAAAATLRQALTEAKQHRVDRVVVLAQYNLVITTIFDDPAAALLLAEENIVQSERFGRPQLRGYAHNGRGLARARTGDHAGAVEDYRTAGTLVLQAGDRGVWLCRLIDNIAVSVAELGDGPRAAELFGAAEAIRLRINLAVNALERVHLDARDGLLAGAAPGVADAWERGLRADLGRATELALGAVGA